MQILSGHDHEPPVFVGPGRIEIRSSTAIEYTVYAKATDDGDAVRRLNRARENPYETFDQFRLVATDYQGVEWAGGWTTPEVKGLPKVGWPLSGSVQGLTTNVSGAWVSPDSSVELVFHPKLWLPMEKAMVTVTAVDGEEVLRRHSAGQQVVDVLGTSIRFFYSPSDDSLWATAKTSSQLQHPHAEYWLAESLRVLLGQLIYPRLVARNFGDGSAFVSLLPSPRRFQNSGIASLIGGDALGAGAAFWEQYASYLTLVAEARDQGGHPNFESHPVSRFYEEIIQATQGSRWVLCMTLASSAEGLAKMMMGPRDRKVDTFLKKLVKRGVLLDDHQKSWTAVRHQVMHGVLVSPWATKEEDERLRSLADLVHRLTRELVRLRTGGTQMQAP